MSVDNQQTVLPKKCFERLTKFDIYCSLMSLKKENLPPLIENFSDLDGVKQSDVVAYQGELNKYKEY
ncbi:MAG: hypothetical protein MJ054_00435 [Clostridia bacterium]|nr:hypothetical protein [Clostridia bacterium]